MNEIKRCNCYSQAYSTPAALADNRVWFHNSRFSLTNDMSVWARGINASVVESDIGTVNGVIHIIDRVLGVPYMTIGQYMESDPDMRYGVICTILNESFFLC